MMRLLQFVAVMTMLVEFILSSINVNYHNEAAFDNLNCRPGHSVFTGTTSRIGCGAQCQSKAGCHSYFYNSVDKKCYGCKCIYLATNATTSLPSSSGTKYYATKVDIPLIDVCNYTHYLDHQWTIEAPADMIISIQFYNIDIEGTNPSSPNIACPYDYVQVYDGPTSASQLLNKFCGNHSEVLTFKSSAHQMLVTFHTDISKTYGGFASTINFENN